MSDRAVDPTPLTSLLRALQHDDARAAKAILDAHPGLTDASPHAAAAAADGVALQRALTNDPGAATRAWTHGPEPLIYACHGGLQDLLGVAPSQRVDTVRALLDAGASPNASVEIDPHANARIPALFFACVSNNVEVARLLLERGAEPNDGESVFHAAEWNHRECLELLLAHGADISSPHSHWGNTPLYFLAGYRENNPRCASSELGMRWLLEHGADPNVLSNVRAGEGGTPASAEMPLHRVADFGRSAAVAMMLVRFGSAIDVPRADGRTPYTLAVRAGNRAVASYLADEGARVDGLSAVDRLLGACREADGTSASAVITSHPGVMSQLTAQDRRSIIRAITDCDAASVTLMLSLGWPLDDEDPWGGTPLHWAAWHGRLEMVRLLLPKGAEVNRRDSQYGSSPIAWAAHGSTNACSASDADYVAIVSLLLDHGATREASFNRWEETPESMASSAVAALLTERGFAS
ncbi:MAG TPA: ankyrin repeat domain-containing protein [Gemmatimonas sp.]|nr:ankyrin repeat domain-containing protein [Gemmatimonas sp.]